MNIQLSIHQGIGEENNPRMGTESPFLILKDKKELYFLLTQSQEYCLFPPVRLENLIIHRALGEAFRRILPQ